MTVSRTIPPGERPVDPDLDVREGLEAGGKRFRSGRLEPELHPVDTNTSTYVPWSSVVCPTKGFYFIALRGGRSRNDGREFLGTDVQSVAICRCHVLCHFLTLAPSNQRLTQRSGESEGLDHKLPHFIPTNYQGGWSQPLPFSFQRLERGFRLRSGSHRFSVLAQIQEEV